MASKRNRSSNWTPIMKELLVESVKPHSNIIDSKLNDGKSLKAKFEVWQNIESTFKASGHDFTAKQIREQWNRLKTSARKNISAFSRSQKETGGGTPPKEPSEIDFQISAVSAMDFEEDIAEFDCDALFSNEKENQAPSAPLPPLPSLPKKTIPFKRKTPRMPNIKTADELVKKRLEQIDMETEKKKKNTRLKRTSSTQKARSAGKKTSFASYGNKRSRKK